MTDSVRVRFAPSPTGFPHVGNIRTALFAWLFARHNGGSFIVRIEDTDVERTVEGAVEAILDSLKWLGMNWDEGPEVGGPYAPYFQSERLELYHKAAQRLIEQGDAYNCYCSPERLAEMRTTQVRSKQPTGYDRTCRNLTAEERRQKEAEGITPVVRLKTPLEGQTSFRDIIWGTVSFKNINLDDLVLLKSDGYPTYHLANIVDDHEMKISHVIRAEEWLSSTPRHVLLYKAMRYEPPAFAHVPMLLGPDKSKLSKRHGAVGINEYRDEGYLPEAMINFLSLLGWSLDDKTEIMTVRQIVDNFSLDRVSRTAAIFNKEKLNWMNGVYLRQLSPDEFTEQAIPFLEKGLPAEVKRPLSREYITKIMPLIQERARTLGEIVSLTRFFFVDELDYQGEELIGKNMTEELTFKALETAGQKLGGLKEFNNESLEELLRPLAVDLEIKTGQLFSALRVATTGETAAPPLFQTMTVLGRDKCLERIKKALVKLQGLSA